MAEKGYKGIGLDFSKSAIAVAEDIRNQRNISESSLLFKLGGLKDVPKRNFDLIICCEVLEHIKNDDDFLKDLHKLHTKYMILSVPARQKWFDRFDERVGHYRRYEKQELKDQLEKHGFRVKKFRSYGYPFINLTRLVRRVMAHRVKDQENIVSKTQESGISPIKVPSLMKKIDLEPIIIPFFFLSRLFEHFNLSEGYLVLCEKKK